VVPEALLDGAAAGIRMRYPTLHDVTGTLIAKYCASTPAV
jgi:hypothetical protein